MKRTLRILLKLPLLPSTLIFDTFMAAGCVAVSAVRWLHDEDAREPLSLIFYQTTTEWVFK